ncbi:MAG: hypothetical protein CNE95_04495 [Puniceicoccaceae bacterium MED-G30]|nr:MAG: hypothetical protein CNE95_04495 [Puniceicoccaceae bacterium MED-G30]RPG84332.1 MAG: hypothetical protein CBC33_006505 [Coraliomargarita sp. TMED73]
MNNKSLFYCLIASSMVSSVSAVMNIVLDYGDTSAQDISSYGAAFTAAERFWESRVTGYIDQGNAAPSELRIDVSLGNIDGFAGTLGTASVTRVNFLGSFVEPTRGEMTFDTTDIPFYGNTFPGTFEDVIRHEMGHVLGLGLLWTFNDVYVDGTGQYTGAAGLAAFREEFNAPTAAFVPVELAGGAGTADGHWDEGTNFASNGRRLDDELMSGSASGNMWLSNTTLQSFRDIGYTVVPEPAAYALWIGFLCICRAFASRSKAGNSAA